MGREEDYINSYKNEEDRINSEYQLAKDRNYIQLRDKQIQLENAKQNALRSTRLMQGNAGFNSQGYGSSMTTGVYNNYLNAFNQASIDTNQTIAGLEQKQREELTKARADQVDAATKNMENARDVDVYNRYLESMGYGAYDNDGNFALSENAPSNMTKEQWNNFKFQYDNMFGESQEDKLAYDSTSLPNAVYVKANGTTGTLGADFKYETENLLARAGSGEFKYGDVFKLKNTSGESVYLKFGKNGFSVTNEDEFKEKGDDAYVIDWNHNDQYKFTTVGNEPPFDSIDEALKYDYSNLSQERKYEIGRYLVNKASKEMYNSKYSRLFREHPDLLDDETRKEWQKIVLERTKLH